MKLPQAWITAGSKAESKIEARVDMSADVAGKGKCPVCHVPMDDVMVSGTRMWACSADRITIPIPNQDGN